MGSKFPDFVCRPTGAQFFGENLIALFEFESTTADGVRIAMEKHYQLVPPADVTPELLKSYKARLDT